MSTALHTSIVPDNASRRIDLGDCLLSMGSCFSEHITRKLEERRFDISQNPTGILYNPLSILQALLRLSENRPYDEGELFEHGGVWHSFDHHGSFSDPSRERLLANINSHYAAAVSQLSRCDHLLLTFGTAYGWFLRERPETVVANCHRMPDSHFRRRLISHNEITDAYRTLLDHLFAAHPDTRVMLTVSPIRYLRGTATENSVSKSHLHIAVNALADSYPNVIVFPAYEILIDELRDYRFYGRDLVHPSDLAVELVWERFCCHCLATQAVTFIEDYEPLLQAMEHRNRRHTGGELNRFAERTLDRINGLSEKYPAIDFSRERDHFTRLKDA